MDNFRGGAYELNTPSLTDTLFEAIRRRIIDEEIKPGAKLTEARVVAEYRVARPTAKACIDRLVATGLLRRSTNKTAIVTDLREKDVVDLFYSRRTLEVAVARKLASGTGVPARSLEAQGNVESAVLRRNYSDMVSADIAFHTSLVAGCGSERMLRMYNSIASEIELTMGLYSAHRTVSADVVAHEHQVIIDAINTKDEKKAVEAVSAHLDAAEARILHAQRARMQLTD